MTFSTRLACLSVAALGLTISVAGCGADDNAKTSQTNSDGTATKVISDGPVKSAEDQYKDMQSKTGSNDLMKTKGYKK